MYMCMCVARPGFGISRGCRRALWGEARPALCQTDPLPASSKQLTTGHSQAPWMGWEHLWQSVYKGKKDTEVVRIEEEKSEKQSCEMGTRGKREKEQAFPKELQPWKTCMAAQIYEHPNFLSSFSNECQHKYFKGLCHKAKIPKKSLEVWSGKNTPKYLHYRPTCNPYSVMEGTEGACCNNNGNKRRCLLNLGKEEWCVFPHCFNVNFLVLLLIFNTQINN